MWAFPEAHAIAYGYPPVLPGLTDQQTDAARTPPSQPDPDRTPRDPDTALHRALAEVRL